MAKNNKRKYAAVALGIIGIAGLGLASAATLDVNQSSPLVGIDTDNGCDTDGVNVAYTTSFNGTSFGVSSVEVTAINTACANKTITVYVQDNSATPVTLDTVTATLDASGAASLATTVAVDAEDVYTAAVSIN